MSMNRREFGQTAAAGLVSSAAVFAAKKIPIAVQVYSVRAIAQKDTAGVLEQIQAIRDMADKAGHGDQFVAIMEDAIRRLRDDPHAWGDPLYHASLAATEYEALLTQSGFEVVEHVVEDPQPGGRTVWLARSIR